MRTDLKLVRIFCWCCKCCRHPWTQPCRHPCLQCFDVERV